MRRATTTLLLLLTTKLDFYPRSPCGERRILTITICTVWKFLSTLSLRRATNARPDTRQHDAISIHALLAESDRFVSAFLGSVDNFYPRSPCGERRHKKIQNAGTRLFLSTLSLRRATECTSLAPKPKTFLSTLSLRRATRGVNLLGFERIISIHALLAESDL